MVFDISPNEDDIGAKGSGGLSTIQGTWVKWRTNPMIMNFDEKESSISDLLFPTITICPETKVLKSKLDLISLNRNNWKNISATDSNRLGKLAHICYELGTYLWFHGGYSDYEIYDILTDIAPPFEDVLRYYKYGHKEFRRNKHFVSVLTENGLCFAFNSINSDEIYTAEMAPGMMMVKSNPNIYQWNLENGYTHETNEKEYPLRSVNLGQHTGLRIILYTQKEDLEYICLLAGLGYTVTLSVPGESFGITQPSFRIPLLEDSQISIKPKLITTSKGLRNYSPNQRKCFYNAERQLRFFKVYTQNNCEAKCLANFTKTECECVKFHMPRDDRTEICGAASIRCYRDAEIKLFRVVKTNDSNSGTSKSYHSECNCLPACTSIEYTADIYNMKFDVSVIDKSFKNLTPPTKLNLFYQKYEVESLKRTEVYTCIDFMAICGGLLGLFLGISALSVIELIYFFTLRFFWTIRQPKSESAAVRYVNPISNSIDADTYTISIP